MESSKLFRYYLIRLIFKHSLSYYKGCILSIVIDTTFSIKTSLRTYLREHTKKLSTNLIKLMKQSYFIIAYLVAVLICSIGNNPIENSQQLENIKNRNSYVQTLINDI